MAKKKAVKKTPEISPQDAAEGTNSGIPLGEDGKPLYSETQGTGFNKECSGCHRFFRGSKIKCPACGKDYPRIKGKRQQGKKASGGAVEGYEGNGRLTTYDLCKALLDRVGGLEQATKALQATVSLREFEDK